MADDEYQRTVRARAFDVARYLLPSSTYTGLGYLCSARTLERQISRMAGHPLAEVREIADELRKAATEPAFNPLATRIEPTLAAYTAAHPDADTEALLAEVRAATLSGAASAPTLVRYTAPSAYPGAVLDRARDAAAQLLGGIQPDGRRGVCLAQPVSPPQEVAATLLYRGSDLSYEQILAQLQGLSEPEVEHLAGLAYVDRGPHDDLVREARAGFQLVFDLCLDNGAFRDLHRHRNCVQIVKDFTAANGYDEPPDLEAGGRLAAYRQAMEQAGELAEQLEKQLRGLGQYVLPLAYRRRALFKMDSAQVAYMAEQRTAPAGHFSYREIAYQMYAALAERYPTLAQPIRVTDPSIESFFDR
jgi:thymidylate synthase ThyX